MYCCPKEGAVCMLDEAHVFNSLLGKGGGELIVPEFGEKPFPSRDEDS